MSLLRSSKERCCCYHRVQKKSRCRRRVVGEEFEPEQIRRSRKRTNEESAASTGWMEYSSSSSRRHQGGMEKPGRRCVAGVVFRFEFGGPQNSQCSLRALRRLWDGNEILLVTRKSAGPLTATESFKACFCVPEVPKIRNKRRHTPTFTPGCQRYDKQPARQLTDQHPDPDLRRAEFHLPSPMFLGHFKHGATRYTATLSGLALHSACRPHSLFNRRAPVDALVPALGVQ